MLDENFFANYLVNFSDGVLVAIYVILIATYMILAIRILYSVYAVVGVFVVTTAIFFSITYLTGNAGSETFSSVKFMFLFLFFLMLAVFAFYLIRIQKKLSRRKKQLL